MIWRVRDHATFEGLRRRGQRARRGAVTVVYLPESGPAPRVAYGVGRPVGKAVARNRVRRRLRAIVDEVQREGGLRAGAYLVRAHHDAGRLAYRELKRAVAACTLELGEPDRR